MIDDPEIVARAIAALIDWHRCDNTRCSRHGLLRAGMAAVCPECAMIDSMAGSAFRRVQEHAHLLADTTVLA